MKMNKSIYTVFGYVICGLIFSITSCEEQTPLKQLSATNEVVVDYDEEIENALSDLGVSLSDFYITQPEVDPEKAKLGGELFHDEDLGKGFMFNSAEGTVSCATCHSDSNSGYSTNKIGLGDGSISPQYGHPRVLINPYDLTTVDKQNVTTPTYINCKFTSDYYVLGDDGGLISSGDTASLNNGAGGGFADINKDVDWLEFKDKPWGFGNFVLQDVVYNEKPLDGMRMQAVFGQAVHRMSSTSLNLDMTDEEMEKSHKAVEEYMTYIKSEYGDRLDEHYGGVNDLTVGYAMVDFEESKVTLNDKDNLYNGGDKEALTVNQKKGKLVFIQNCMECHNGKAYGGGFHVSPHKKNADLNGDEMLGRFTLTGVEADRYKIRTPQLKNIKHKVSLTWGGNYRSIGELMRDTEDVDGISDADINSLEDWLINANFDPNLKLDE